MNKDQDILLQLIGDEQVREKLWASRERIARSFDELFSGYKLKAEDVLNEVVSVENYSGLITVSGINFYSFCEHHFAPFFGKASVTYEPESTITGLGKIVRLVHDVHARRLQIQELMTRDIAEDIVRVLHARGAYVETSAKHLCTCSRGPKDDTAETLVRYGCGTLQERAQRNRGTPG
jgi:GTP cyclohydrolase IA